MATRKNSILDWCLTNTKNSVFESSKLPPIGTSDHNTILIKSYFNRLQNHDNSSLFKRDFRNSNLRLFGQWITSFDWDDFYSISDSGLKYEKFHEIINSMMDYYFPVKKTKIRKSDKAWMTPSLKISTAKRQQAFHKYGIRTLKRLSSAVTNPT